MDIKETLKTLCECCGISKNEFSASKTALNMLKPYCDEIYITKTGSVVGLKRGNGKNKRKILLDAHIDEIGLMVSEIDEKGFIHFTPIGGVNVKGLPASEVTIFAKKEIWGIIGTKPPHIQTANEHEKPFSIDDLTIDTGYTKDEISKLVSVGDYISVNGAFCKLSDNRYTSKSLDNRAGVCAVLKTAQMLYNINTNDDVYYLFSTCEEFNMSGAKAAVNEIMPDIALVIDVTHGVTADNKENAYELGKGPSYSIGPNISKPLYKLIESIAKNNNITVHPEVDGSSSGTNAWKMQNTALGTATAVLSVPLKYMHTAVETVDISDIENVCKIACEFACSAGRDDIWF